MASEDSSVSYDSESRSSSRWTQILSASSIFLIGGYIFSLVSEGISFSSLTSRFRGRSETVNEEQSPSVEKENPSSQNNKNTKNSLNKGMQDSKGSRIPRRAKLPSAKELHLQNSPIVAFNIAVGPLPANDTKPAKLADSESNDNHNETSLEDRNLGHCSSIVDQPILKNSSHVIINKPLHICSRRKRLLELQNKQKQVQIDSPEITTQKFQDDSLLLKSKPKDEMPKTVNTNNKAMTKSENDRKTSVPIFNHCSKDQKKMLNELAKEFLRHERQEIPKDIISDCFSQWTSTCQSLKNDQVSTSTGIQSDSSLSTRNETSDPSMCLVPIDTGNNDTINEDAIDSIQKFSQMQWNEKQQFLHAYSKLIITDNIKKLNNLVNQSHTDFDLAKSSNNDSGCDDISSNSCLISDEMIDQLLEAFKEYQLQQIARHCDRRNNKMITYLPEKDNLKKTEKKRPTQKQNIQFRGLKYSNINYDPEFLIDGSNIPVLNNFTKCDNKVEVIQTPQTTSEHLTVTSKRLLDDLSRKVLTLDNSTKSDDVGILAVNENNSAILTTSGTSLKWHNATNSSEINISRSTPELCTGLNTGTVKIVED